MRDGNTPRRALASVGQSPSEKRTNTLTALLRTQTAAAAFSVLAPIASLVPMGTACYPNMHSITVPLCGLLS
jgi:hypothetical protein